ncbi:DUF1178 family protein [Paracoccus luteus]|uniref:DUF1178 family protein n=1 Tax=Paracoccus luteus TaxID=2508543 RepID=UPI00106FF761|nr:DUF1178 family protein [Paracoccus luteus]
MIRYALRCDKGHDFDSWFRSASGSDTLLAGGQVSCVVCGSTQIAKAPMAPAVPVRAAADGPQPLDAPASAAERRLAALRAHVERTSDYVGDAFAAEARDMHDGVKPERPIHGEARLEEARKLLEDGIPVAPLPFGARRKMH